MWALSSAWPWDNTSCCRQLKVNSLVTGAVIFTNRLAECTTLLSGLLKFGYSEKAATKFEKKIFHLKFDITEYLASNFKWNIFSDFVAFSEYPNFT
jgi:hypothetical protein